MYEYPLKIVEINDFTQNRNDVLWRSIQKTHSSLLKQKEAKILNRDASSFTFDNDDLEHVLYSNFSVNKNIQHLFFVDRSCEFYSEKFDQLIKQNQPKDSLIFDREIQIKTIEEAKNLLNFVHNSKRWIFNGCIKHELVNEQRNTSNMKLKRSDSFNLNHINSHLKSSMSNIFDIYFLTLYFTRL
jgi:hypothetical protein